MSPASRTGTDPHVVAERLKKERVRHLLATMTDQAGIMRVKVIPASRVPSAVAHGVSFSLTSALMLCSDDHIAEVPGFAQALGDVRLFPDLSALRIIDREAGLAWMPADQRTPEGDQFPVCQRQALAVQEARGRALGLDFRMAFEIELTVFRRTPEGPALAHSGPGYGLAPVLALESWLTEAIDACQSAGVEIEQFHAEYGAGQVELALRHTSPVQAVDDVTVTRLVLARTAARNHLDVSFAPLTTEHGAGNGVHIHISAKKDGGNVFADCEVGEAMTETGEHLVAGFVHGLPDAVALLAPSVNSYARLQPGHFSGAYACWGLENREAAVRYIPGVPGRRLHGANCEIKTADGAANPYVAAAAVLAIGLHGALENLPIPPGLTCVPSQLDEAERTRIGARRFATDLPGALDLLRHNRVLRSALGDALIDTYIAVRAHEHEAYGELSLAERIPLLRFRY
jgi:glutamine synthetase